MCPYCKEQASIPFLFLITQSCLASRRFFIPQRGPGLWRPSSKAKQLNAEFTIYNLNQTSRHVSFVLESCDQRWDVKLKVILPNFRENRFEVNHLGRRTRVITVGLIGSEASSGLSSSTTGCSLVLSSRHLNHSLVELVSEQSLRDWERDLGLV